MNYVQSWRRSGVFTVNFEHILNVVLVFLFLTLGSYLVSERNLLLYLYYYEKQDEWTMMVLRLTLNNAIINFHN